MKIENKINEIAMKSEFLSDFPHDRRSEAHGALQMANWIKDYLKKELEETNICYEDSFDDIKEFWNGYKNALENVIHNLFEKEEKK